MQTHEGWKFAWRQISKATQEFFFFSWNIHLKFYDGEWRISFFLNYLKTNRGKTKRCDASEEWKKRPAPANIVCVTRHVSAGAERMLTDASNILSDNIASLEHGKPILKNRMHFFFSLSFTQKLCAHVWCNRGRDKLWWLEEEKKLSTRFENEKNAAKEKYVAHWRNWQCLVVVCAVESNKRGREREAEYAVPVSMLCVSCLCHKTMTFIYFRSLFALSQ